jgi:hypothetical protein
MSCKSRAVIFLSADFIGPAEGRRFKSDPATISSLSTFSRRFMTRKSRAVNFHSADFIGRAGARRSKSDPATKIAVPFSDFRKRCNHPNWQSSFSPDTWR